MKYIIFSNEDFNFRYISKHVFLNLFALVPVSLKNDYFLMLNTDPKEIDFRFIYLKNIL